MIDVCIIGDRGHLGYVFRDLPDLPDVSISGISSGTHEDDPDSLKAICQSLGHNPVLYDDWREMLPALRPEIVVVCGPFELHTEMSLTALSLGAHVFCEKPAAITWEDYQRLKDGVAACDRHFATMMGLRYDPAFYAAWKMVRDGAIGKIRLLNGQKSYKLGTRPAYYHQRETYGGTIPWVGSHAIDWIYWFSGAEFLSVMAYQSREGNDGQGDLETAALCQFQMGGDVLASASIDYFRPDEAPSHGDDRLRVVGERGVIEVRDGQVFLINDQQAGEIVVQTDCDRQIFADFVTHIIGESKAIITAEDALAVTEACLLAQISADEKRLITFGSFS